MSYEPKPRSPLRLTMLRDIAGKYDPEQGLVVTASFRYDEWCCGEAHEVVDAVATVYEMFEAAQERAEKKRIKKNKRKFNKILLKEKNRMNGEQLTLF